MLFQRVRGKRTSQRVNLTENKGWDTLRQIMHRAQVGRSRRTSSRPCFEVIEGRILLSHFVNFAGLSAPTYTVTFDEVPLRENDPLLDQYVSYGVKFDDPGIMFD